MSINFELYKVFYHAGSTLSFSEAAAQLHLSQSAVSQSIRQLEERLGSRLFHRNTKHIRFTYEGELLFRHIEQAFHYIKAGERSIGDVHALSRGEIRLGASDTICRYYLLPYLKQFANEYPQVKIAITNRSSSVCLEMVAKGVLDIAVVNLSDEQPPENLSVTPLASLQDVFIAGGAYHHLRDKPLTLTDLTQYPLLLLEKGTVTRNFFEAFTASQQVQLLPEIELNSIDLLLDLTKIGLGISFVAKEYAAAGLEDGSLFTLALRETIPARKLGIATHRTLPLPLAARRFTEMLAVTSPAEQ